MNRTAYHLRWIDRLRKRVADRFYPRSDGDVFVIGPDCFADLDAAVICWQGENYYRSRSVRELIADELRSLATRVNTGVFPDEQAPGMRRALVGLLAARADELDARDEGEAS